MPRSSGFAATPSYARPSMDRHYHEGTYRTIFTTVRSSCRPRSTCCARVCLWLARGSDQCGHRNFQPARTLKGCDALFDRSPDFPECGGCLSIQQSSGACRAFDERFEEIGGGIKPPRQRYRFHAHIRKTSRFERTPRFLRIAKSKERWASWQLNVRIAELSHSVEHRAEAERLVGRRPSAKCETSA